MLLKVVFKYYELSIIIRHMKFLKNSYFLNVLGITIV